MARCKQQAHYDLVFAQGVEKLGRLLEPTISILWGARARQRRVRVTAGSGKGHEPIPLCQLE